MRYSARSNLKLGVLDQCPIPEGATPGDALRNTLELAQMAEAAGYTRYWLAEHHGTPGLACTSPEVLAGPVASATSRIRVGSGGVMLPHYSPLKVAENFRILGSLYPSRIDLGIGRAAGTSRNVAFALQRDRRHPAPDDFFEQLNELLGYIEEQGLSVRPEPWLLGSSPQSAIWAAELGLPYVFADFINPQGEAIADHYRKAFDSTAGLEQPRTAVAVWAVCAETDDEAERLSLSARMMLAMLARGRLIPVPTVERAQEYFAGERTPLELLTQGRRFITGSPEKVRTRIEEVAAAYGAEEVLLVNILHDHAARLRSYELIAEAFDLAGRARQSAVA